VRVVPDVAGKQKDMFSVSIPHGSGELEWTGKWNGYSDDWQNNPEIWQTIWAIHPGDADDGTFWISWEDFQHHFNRIYVCRIFETVDMSLSTPSNPIPQPHGTWCRYDISSEWTHDTAGGCFNFPSWRVNPQFEIDVGSKASHAVFVIMQPDPRMQQGGKFEGGGDEGGPKYDHKIGMYVMKSDGQGKKVLYDSEDIDGDDVVDSTPYIEYREAQCNTMDEAEDERLAAGKPFVLCPSTFEPGKLGKFRVIVLTEFPLKQPPRLLPKLSELRVSGRWVKGSTAGGCRNYFTWRKNEQFLLRMSRSARASVVMMREDPETKKLDKPLFGKKSKSKTGNRKNHDRSDFYIGFTVARADPRRLDLPLLHVDEDQLVEKTTYTLAFEAAREMITPKAEDFVITPTTFEANRDGEYELVVWTNDPSATLSPLDLKAWQRQPAHGDWDRRSAGGSRNYYSWVNNPLFALRVRRDTTVHVFLRQPFQQEGVYHGIGFYVLADEGVLDLAKTHHESGFRSRQEVHAAVKLSADRDYLLLPMTYKHKVEQSFDLEIYSEQPIQLIKLSEKEAYARREPHLENHAASLIAKAFARKKVRRAIRSRRYDDAKALMQEWFRKPTRDNDEGYLDINLALNALESAFIQLTGKLDRKGSFFPRMRERLAERGHTVADYDVCL